MGHVSPVGYFPLRQRQRVRQAPETGSLGGTSVAVIACPFKFLP